MLKEYIEIGKIVGTHGVKGAVRLQPWCDSAGFAAGFKTFYFSPDKPVNCIRSAAHGNLVLLWLDKVETVEAASLLRGKTLFVKREDILLKEGQYLIQDIVGCTVFDAQSGIEYGVITDAFSSGANDVWEIKKDGKEYLLPVIDSVVKEVDINNQSVKITPMKGIFDED